MIFYWVISWFDVLNTWYFSIVNTIIHDDDYLVMVCEVTTKGSGIIEFEARCPTGTERKPLNRSEQMFLENRTGPRIQYTVLQ